MSNPFFFQGGEVHSITSASKRNEQGAGASRESCWWPSFTQPPQRRLPLHSSVCRFSQTTATLRFWAPARHLSVREEQPSLGQSWCLHLSPSSRKPQPRPLFYSLWPIYYCTSSWICSDTSLCVCRPFPWQPPCSTRTHGPSFTLAAALTF